MYYSNIQLAVDKQAFTCITHVLLVTKPQGRHQYQFLHQKIIVFESY